MANLSDDRLMELMAGRVDLRRSERAPARLKAKVYSALLREQAKTGPLMSLRASKSGGRALCVFEELVCIAPLGESAKSRNICRVCHARLLAESMENAPIYWSGCPYVELKKS
jgi:hypothetical protein